MINFEDYISKNKEEFNSEPLPEGHEFRFQQKLNPAFNRKNSFIIKYSVAIAASILIFLASTIYVYTLKKDGYKGAIEASQSVEFQEAVKYYTEVNDAAMIKLKETLSAQPDDVSSPVISEFKEMEDTYRQLMSDLKANPNDIRIMSAVVQHHQLKQDLINNLIERFTLYSNIKTQRHEKDNI